MTLCVAASTQPLSFVEKCCFNFNFRPFSGPEMSHFSGRARPTTTMTARKGRQMIWQMVEWLAADNKDEQLLAAPALNSMSSSFVVMYHRSPGGATVFHMEMCGNKFNKIAIICCFARVFFFCSSFSCSVLGHHQQHVKSRSERGRERDRERE